MSREIPPYGLRMPPALKADLEKKAEKNGRSLNSEIVAILTAAVGKTKTEEPLPTKVQQEKAMYRNDYDEMLLRIFHAMPVEKQLALLSLFK